MKWKLEAVLGEHHSEPLRAKLSRLHMCEGEVPAQSQGRLDFIFFFFRMDFNLMDNSYLAKRKTILKSKG